MRFIPLVQITLRQCACAAFQEYLLTISEDTDASFAATFPLPAQHLADCQYLYLQTGPRTESDVNNAHSFAFVEYESRRDADDERERLAFMRALVAAQEESGEVFSAIADSDSEDDARAAVVRLLGVNTMAAEAIMATPIGQFSKDHRASNRRTLETMEHRSEN